LQTNEKKHWDLALLMSGVDMYGLTQPDRYGSRREVYSTMGLSTVTGVCEIEFQGVIAEVGVTDERGNPYPSAGFLTIFVMAHEIAHNLGNHHDSTENHCNKEGYIMSPVNNTLTIMP
jgi:hypothetical protein